MDPALKKRLEALLKLPGNQFCVDCKKRGPRWASANLGVFMCIECSGIHRNLGVHISFVRSVNLDTWTRAQVENMEEWGNTRANLYYEANVPAHVHRPKEGDSVRIIEKYIRDKYEMKRYIANSVPPKDESGVAEDPSSEEGKRTRRTPNTSVKSRTPQEIGPSIPLQSSGKSIPVAPSPVAAAPVSLLEDSLIDFSEVPVNNPQTFAVQPQQQVQFQDFQQAQPQQTQQTQNQQNQQNQQSEWGNFESSATVAANPNTNIWNNWNNASEPVAPPQNYQVASQGAPQTQTQAQAQVPQVTKPTVSADSILNMFNTAPPVTPGMNGLGGYGGMNALNNLPDPMNLGYSMGRMPNNNMYPPMGYPMGMNVPPVPNNGMMMGGFGGMGSMPPPVPSSQPMNGNNNNNGMMMGGFGGMGSMPPPVPSSQPMNGNNNNNGIMMGGFGGMGSMPPPVPSSQPMNGNNNNGIMMGGFGGMGSMPPPVPSSQPGYYSQSFQRF